MHKKIIAMGLCLLMLAGCSASSTDTAAETTAAETTEAVTEAETTEETTEETAEEIVDEEEIEFVDEEIEEAEYWTDEAIQEYVGSEYNLPSSSQVSCFKQNGAALVAYVDDNANSYVIYCSADGNAELLFEGNGPMGAVVECYNSDTFADYQRFDNTFYIITDMVMGIGQPIKTWHLTADGTVVDLADALDFEVENNGLYVFGTVIDGAEKTVIGLREQIPDTEAVGASQLVPVTLKNEKLVKLDIVIGGEDTAAEVIHEWENIDYSAELDIPESGHTYGEEIPFYDYALNVIGDETVLDYFIENSPVFQEFLSYTSYDGYVGRINGDFDKDGEQEYLIATNFGHAYYNNIAIIDDGEVVCWVDKDTSMTYFYKVRVGEYLKADPERLTNFVPEDYIKYTFTDYTVNEDNMFIGVRSNQREAYNYYYQIIYDEADGYSIKPIKRIGWETRQFEGDDGPVFVREFVEETF